MLRQFKRPIYCLFILVLSTLNVFAISELDLAETLIEQNDCENALPILVSIHKNSNVDKKRVLIDINTCAEKKLNYSLKEISEKKLIQLDPKDLKIQLRYLDSLFYLSKYQELIQFSKNKKSLFYFDDYWMLLGRSLYEINENEKSISVFEKYLEKKEAKKKDEAYYWLIKNYLQIEDYSNAEKYLNKISELKEVTAWFKDKIPSLREYIKINDKRFSFNTKFQIGSDDNILKTHERISDNTTLIDMYFDYNLINKRKHNLMLGLDINYQGYAKFTEYQTMSVAPRIGQSFDIIEKFRGEYLISFGKTQTNFKADQNYYFISNYYYLPVNSTLELQPSLSYFQNLNNNPVSQFNISIFANIQLKTSLFWLGPYYAESSSPEAEIDSTTYTIPVITKYSLITRYHKSGLIAGHQYSFSDKWSFVLQYSIAQVKYNSPDLSLYNSTQVDSFDDRVDLNQTVKMSLNYRTDNRLRYNLTYGYNNNTSKGFAGFNSDRIPDNNYSQMHALFGITYRTP